MLFVLVDADPVEKEVLPVDVGVKAVTPPLSKLQLTTRVANAKTAADNRLRLEPLVLFAVVPLLLLLQKTARWDLFLLKSHMTPQI
mmetsp:Transcript_9412/g.28100  ORF Transcript_9412/g.28100 Transcript_9412/m.28100 type:complete len:86 (-) Transcript_9412:100-357(-)